MKSISSIILIKFKVLIIDEFHFYVFVTLECNQISMFISPSGCKIEMFETVKSHRNHT